ncbi:unnamed protein product [Rhizophagus irregularis]|nr:unnamed protein product [Rhizophagus irregularis]
MIENIQNIYVRDTETRLNPKPHIVYKVEVNAAVRTCNPPPFEMPAKHYFQSTLGNPVLVEERRRGLEDYLRGILFHKDDRYRETDEWRDFLAIPTGRLLDAASMYTSETWLDEYNEVQAKAKEIRSLLNKRENSYCT